MNQKKNQKTEPVNPEVVVKEFGNKADGIRFTFSKEGLKIEAWTNIYEKFIADFPRVLPWEEIDHIRDILKLIDSEDLKEEDESEHSEEKKSSEK